MMASKSIEQLQLFEMLDDFLAKLAGGRASIGAFKTWFMSSEWEARMASDSAALRLGWRIQNLLYTWQDYHDAVTTEWILSGIQGLVDEEPSLRPFLATSMASGQEASRTSGKNVFQGDSRSISIGWAYPVFPLGATSY